MKEAIDDVKNEVKAKFLLWKNIKNTKVKVILIFLFLGLVGLKVFTTVLTFDWLARLLS
jgi:2-phosphoglycerate kinase